MGNKMARKSQEEILKRLSELGYEFPDRSNISVIRQLDEAWQDKERVPYWLRAEAHAMARRLEQRQVSP